MKKSIVLAMLTAAALLQSAAIARAADPLCEGTLWAQIAQRATLQGHIDTAIAENRILKQDSVLEYTCSEQFMNIAAANMPYYFNPGYVTGTINPGMRDYLYANFPHTYLGGRLSNPSTQPMPTSGAYICDAMAYIWDVAKCMNFVDLSPQDEIYGLDEFINAADIRRLPVACQAPNKAIYGVIPVKGPAIAPNLQTNANDCGQPVPTGLVINQPLGIGDNDRPERYREKICPNPACHYKPTGENAGTCVL